MSYMSILGQEDFTSHLYSSVQKPKKVTTTPTAAGHDPAKASGCDELDATAQESKLIFVCWNYITFHRLVLSEISVISVMRLKMIC